MLRENFQKCREKKTQIQESRILKNKVYFKYIFHPLQVYISYMTYNFISDETCDVTELILSTHLNKLQYFYGGKIWL